jgi:hypothetical protein
MNTLPEWFTVQPAQTYTIQIGTDGSSLTLTGKQLHDGLELSLEAEQTLVLVTSPRN